MTPRTATAGPWQPLEHPNGDIEIVVRSGDVLATVHGDWRDDDPAMWPVRANARLIAAAPELLVLVADMLSAQSGTDIANCHERGRALLARINGDA